VFQQVGKFDEQYDLYFGDNDFARTLKHSPIIHAMVPSSWVEHYGGYTTKNYDASGTVQYAADMEKYKKKWRDDELRIFVHKSLNTFTRWIAKLVKRR